MPTWLQIVVPIVTAFLGFALGRLNGVLDRRRARREAEKSRAPVFTLAPYRKDRYQLINSGTARATGIDFEFDGKPLVRLPDQRELAPDESVVLMLSGSMQVPKPHQIRVTCNELSAPQILPVPAS